MHCKWQVQVPKGRRVRLEILDFNTGTNMDLRGRLGFRGRLTVANDFKMQSILGRYNVDPPAEVLSSDNTMGIDAFLLPIVQNHGIKLRFSAYGSSSCPGFTVMMNEVADIQFQRFNISRPLHCSYKVVPPSNSTLLIRVGYSSQMNCSF